MSPNSDIDRLKRLEEIFEQRFSCRAYLSDEVPRELIHRILRAARHTASWCNAQPWVVQVVSGAALDALRQDLYSHPRKGIAAAPEIEWPVEYGGVYRERRRSSGRALYEALGIGAEDREGSLQQARENFRLFGAPHLAVVSCEAKLGAYGVMDCGAWVANFLVAACAAGVAAVPQGSVTSWPGVLRKHLEIAREQKIVCGISFGFPDLSHPANGFRTSRAELAENVVFVD